MSAPSPPPTVLIVDDEPLILRMMCRLLKRHATVIPCSSGRSALKTLRSVDSIDLILSDIIMPDMTGLELFRIVQERHPEYGPHFVLFSGGSPALHTLAQSDPSWPPLLSKPVKLKTLLDLIHANARDTSVLRQPL